MIMLNPECQQMKCKNCDGTGLDLQTDEFVNEGCPCDCHDEDDE